ncbi:MAG: response regulator [Archangium sp.]|nr:response regulator [Archangium sp.]
MIVEDEPLVGHSLLRQFDKLGCHGHLVRDPLLAAAALEAAHPALIISDLNMPGLSGVDVLSAARERHPNVKRCLVSGSLHDLKASDLPRIQPCVILAKPFRLDDLRRLISTLEPVSGEDGAGAAPEGQEEHAALGP